MTQIEMDYYRIMIQNVKRISADLERIADNLGEISDNLKDIKNGTEENL